MYQVKHNYVLLEIPKNGSRSLIQAASQFHGKGWMKCQGHHTFAEFIDGLMEQQVERSRWPSNPVCTYAVFRHPRERLLSCVKQYIRKKSNVSIDDALKVAQQQSDVVFKPQHRYVQAPTNGDWMMDLHMWDIGRISEAIEWITGRQSHVHKNRDPGTPVDGRQIEGHPAFNALLETIYADDFWWYDRATKTDFRGR